MDHYTLQTLARQRMDEVARSAEGARIRGGFARTPARRHFPRVNWHLPVHTRLAGA